MPEALQSDMRRVAIQTDAGRLDLALSAEIAVAAMIPAIVDVAVAASSAVPLAVPTSWQLTRVGGSALSSRHSLQANGVNDGDLLVLTHIEPAETVPVDDSIAAIATSLGRVPRWTQLSSRAAGVAVSLCCGGLAAFALLRGAGAETAMIAGSLGIAAFIGAVMCARVCSAPIAEATLAGLAVICATAAGYVSVPGDSTAPKLMLAAASCATASVLAIRWVGNVITVFVATATFGALIAVGTCPGLVAPLGTAATGSILAATAMAVLASAARIALSASRLPVPRLPDASGRSVDGTAYADDDVLRAHAMATGLICGSSVAAALGAVLAASGATPAGALFAIVVGLATALRAGSHVDLVQSGALMFSGAVCVAAAFVWSVNAWPQHAHWVALVAAAVAVVSVRLSATSAPPNVSPFARRCGDLIEYGALAAVIPLACLLSGVFGAVWGLR
jgi:type VII secretion integral membrane protein EccD